MKTLRLFLGLFFYPFSFTAAQDNLVPKYEIGIVGGVLVYQGDLTPNDVGEFKMMKPAIGVFATRNINRFVAFRLQLLRGSLKGDDAKYENPSWRRERNFNFKTPVTELSAVAVVNLLGLKANEAGIINFTPYVFGGVGYSFLKVKRDWSNFNYSHFSGETAIVNGLDADIDHGVPKGIFEFPIGMGLRYGISEKISFNIEGTYRLTSTDYIDGFSQAANPDRNDHFHSLTVGLIYSFGKRNKFDCPTVKQ